MSHLPTASVYPLTSSRTQEECWKPQATFVQPECAQTPSSALYPCSGIMYPSGGFYFILIFKSRRSRLTEGLLGRVALSRVVCVAATQAAASGLEPGQDGGTEWMPGATQAAKTASSLLRPPRQWRWAPQTAAWGARTPDQQGADPGPRTSLSLSPSVTWDYCPLPAGLGECLAQWWYTAHPVNSCQGLHSIQRPRKQEEGK